MSKKAAFYALFLLIVCAAILFRVVRLDLRPMHHDEANQAVKFGDLLERGEYRYDPIEHHGPTLYYFSLLFAWISSGTSFAALDEVTLRLVPALFGVGLVLLLLLLKDGFSRSAIVFSGILIAVSPLMVFYSRFYIQETLLVFFLLGTIAASWRYHVDRTWGWAAAIGLFIGLMYATKETCIIAFGALFVGLLFIFFFTLLSTAVYSLIPYKTPWNMLPFFIGLVLLAGNGAAFLVERSKNLALRSLILLILCAGIFHLGCQAHSAIYRFHVDSRNPYVYAHTSPDFLNLVRRVEDIARYHPDQKDILIKIITYPDEAWPLPWYLRAFTRVGYWQEADEAGAVEDVPIVISSIDKTEKIQTKLQQTHQGEFFGLRPEVLLAVHIRKDLWEKFLENKR